MAATGSKSLLKQTSSARSQSSARGSAPRLPSASGSKLSNPKPSVTTTTTAPKKFELPALSVPYAPKTTVSELEKLKKKTIRRNAPPGEDLKAIKTILQNVKRNKDITVQEFISLVAPSTGDRGEALRQVMNEDLVAFRRLARKVYDTITQDNSDVLLNQQMQLSDYYREKKKLLNNRMMAMIEEIFTIVPNFDFDRYSQEKDQYLQEILPIPEAMQVEPEEMEMMKRQAAYHRLQWLRSEGERLNDENNSLKKRLNQMKKLHMEEQRRMVDIERMAEAKKEELEEEEADKQEMLDTLNKSLEKTIIQQEQSMREAKDAAALDSRTRGVRKTKSKGKVRSGKFKRPKWNEEAAAEIESRVLEEGSKTEKRKVVQKDPFHFSPLKTPSPKTSKPRELSPFHYSPPKSPIMPVTSPRAASPRRSPLPQVQQPAYTHQGRRAQAPRDTWGGFY